MRTETLVAATSKKPNNRLRELGAYLVKKRYLYLMSIPGLVYIIIFKYVPMYGIMMAFQDFNFKKGIFGSPFNNFANFKQLFTSDIFYNVFLNSITLSVMRLIITFPIPIILALLLNEIKLKYFKKFSQTFMYLPHFISWVVLGGILTNFLSMNDGLINFLIEYLTGKRINFLGSAEWFRAVIIGSSIWKEAGWGTIVYLAGLSAINPDYYEAATVDGANRYQKLWYITIPGLANTIVVMLILAVGGLMNNGFEQIYLFQNGLNISVSDVFETYTYRIGIVGGRYSYSTAVGLFQSVVAAIMLFSANYVSNKIRGDSLLR
ncbi:ABC transporter permease subunit [Pseudoclostridium thermosuccinogenes]|jgi:putative aldouronate transport system permease protein|uniref:ABC transporter permease n=1 Tax=Clostridium thermosuccinogenes TaxID=84032 RepID=UPI002FDA9C2D